MKKCIKCNGHKTILGMGGVRLKCTDCKGLGFLVEVKAANAKDEPILSQDPPLPIATPMTSKINKKAKLKEVKMEQVNV